ncbi:uncharacterized protein BDCG_06000 [Blastomyces dermatitidis ER-3]|uniref:Uncharacterized protein n=1 Tax=Ajellomyces dermatitidis (strain ER-3 / ATCC MYA-2586) TaxID=559297 RepID=A0ABP2F269_AJEDR|nr:uncharacterized protein BDCG_06000 [Blastomyces dermatitidis ER-3]EEQ90880.2 hypothetical protein BDCG_06000 [Blastomyces dermatitidis ER-3]
MAMAKFGGFTAAEPQHRAASHVMLFFFVVVELLKAQKSRTKEPHQDQRAPYFPQGYSAVPMRRRGGTCLHSVGWEFPAHQIASLDAMSELNTMSFPIGCTHWNLIIEQHFDSFKETRDSDSPPSIYAGNLREI